MKYKIKKNIGLIIFYIIKPFLKFVLNPNRSCALLVDFEAKEVLLVKNLLGSQKWKAPGGGIKRGETVVDGICREILEEINLRLNPDKLRQVYTETSYSRFSKGQMTYFIYPFKKRKIDYNQREILAVSWQSLTFRSNLQPPLDKILSKLLNSEVLEAH